MAPTAVPAADPGPLLIRMSASAPAACAAVSFCWNALQGSLPVDTDLRASPIHSVMPLEIAVLQAQPNSSSA
jgi:hypothetical protein